ncbi:MAG: O-antigen polymerase [Fusobacterium gastrosuis]|uniref:O-antigen polymerase n=1 Tax=Fusobacterium gastrosuis TaxID=1755100 RepID=UPI002A9A0EC5|nr:O-antigen polymerase [Fusobacterium gastrosuis]
MIYILFIGLVFLFIFSYCIFKKNLLNPSVVLCSVFMISTFFFMLNYKKWGIYINEKTILIIFLTIISFIAGNLLIYFNHNSKKYKILKKQDINTTITIGIKKTILIDLLLLVGLKFYIKNVYEISLLGGNTGGYENMLFYARQAKLNFYDINRVSINIFYFTKAISYIYIYNFLNFTFQKGLKLKKIYLLSPVIIYLVFLIFSTGRTELIYLFIYSLTIYFVLLYRQYNFDTKINKKIIIYSLLSWGVFIIFFFISGKILGRSDSKMFYSISRYTGSSIAALNSFLNNNIENNNIYFGQNTLFSIYSILRKLNRDIPNFYAPYEFVYFNDMRTNIYSAIRRYTEDYGMVGLYSITFFLGAFYGRFFDYVTYKKKNFLLIMYSVFSFPIFEFPIEERFFMVLFPSGFINNFIFIGSLYYILIYRPSKKYKRKRN